MKSAETTKPAVKPKVSPKRGTFEVQPRRALEGRTRPLRPEEVSRLYAVRSGRPPKVT